MAVVDVKGAKASVNALAVVAALIATLSFTAILTPPFSSPPFVYPGHPFNDTEVKEQQTKFWQPDNIPGLVLPGNRSYQTIDPVYNKAFPYFVLFTQLAFDLSMVALFMASITSAVVSTFQYTDSPDYNEQWWWGLLVVFICIPLVLAYIFLLAAFGQVSAILTEGYREMQNLDQKSYLYTFWILCGLFGIFPLFLFVCRKMCVSEGVDNEQPDSLGERTLKSIKYNVNETRAACRNIEAKLKEFRDAYRPCGTVSNSTDDH